MSKFKINDRVNFYNMEINRELNGYIIKKIKNKLKVYTVECDYANDNLYYHNMNRDCRFFNVAEHQIRKINE